MIGNTIMLKTKNKTTQILTLQVIKQLWGIGYYSRCEKKKGKSLYGK